MDKYRPGTHTQSSKIPNRRIQTACDRTVHQPQQGQGHHGLPTFNKILKDHAAIRVEANERSESKPEAYNIFTELAPVTNFQMDPKIKQELRSKILASSRNNVSAFRNQLHFHVNEQIEAFIRLKWFQFIESPKQADRNTKCEYNVIPKHKFDKHGGGDATNDTKVYNHETKSSGFDGGGDAGPGNLDQRKSKVEWKIEHDQVESQITETKETNENDPIREEAFLKSFRGCDSMDQVDELADSYGRFYNVTTENNTLTPTKIELVTSEIINNLKQFINQPVIIGIDLNCKVTRIKHGVGRNIFPEYCLKLELDGKEVPILYARKRKKSKSSCYIFSMDSNDLVRHGHSYAGKVQCSNLVGTQFRIFSEGISPKKFKMSSSNNESDLREELGVINYEHNILGLKGPRKMKIVIPSMINLLQRHVHRLDTDCDDPSSPLELSEKAVVLQNKNPVWNSEYASHTLNFGGRVTVGSVKNFQIVLEGFEDKILLQFGKINEDVFTLDFGFPFCPLQAFGIGISSLDPKLGCD